MSEEKVKKNLNVNFFFPVWNNFGSSEDPSPIEYTAHGLMYKLSFQGISFGHAWVVATRPTEDWGPALPEHWPDIHKATQTDLPDHMGSTITVNGITPSYPGLQDEKHAYLNPGYSQDRF